MPVSHQTDTPIWILFVWCSFICAVTLMGLGIFYAPVSLWVKGYLAMGLFFTIGSTFTLAKTIRDQHERERRASEGKAAAPHVDLHAP